MCPPTSLCSHVRPPPSVRPSLSPCAVSPALITPTYDLLLSRLRGLSPPRPSVSVESTAARRARGIRGRHASKLRLAAPLHATSSLPRAPRAGPLCPSRALPRPRQGSGPAQRPFGPAASRTILELPPVSLRCLTATQRSCSVHCKAFRCRLVCTPKVHHCRPIITETFGSRSLRDKHSVGLSPGSFVL